MARLQAKAPVILTTYLEMDTIEASRWFDPRCPQVEIFVDTKWSESDSEKIFDVAFAQTKTRQFARMEVKVRGDYRPAADGAPATFVARELLWAIAPEVAYSNGRL